MYFKEDFINFLINAKKATYASQGDDASVVPLLDGSMQLEFQSGDFIYRDIYFGMCYFIGQETVYFKGKPIWSMAYSGGVDEKYEMDFVREVYAFLRTALREVPSTLPYRGPSELSEGNFVYLNKNHGFIEQFSGREIISFKDCEVYSLNYSGGFVR